MTVEVIGPTAGTTVEAQIECGDNVTQAGPMLVGSGMFDPCEQEPCKTERQGYINAAIIAIEAAREVSIACVAFKIVLGAFLIVLLMWTIVLAAVIACEAAPVFPVLCYCLYALLLAFSAALAVAAALLWRATAEMRDIQRQCRIADAIMKIRYIKMQTDCPNECWVPEVKVDCGCV